MTLEEKIDKAGIPLFLRSFSAIDSYLNRNPPAGVYAVCRAGLADLACLFEDIKYPGAVFADASVEIDGKTWYFRCEDSDETFICTKNSGHNNCSFDFLEFFQDCRTGCYYDPNGIYPVLRRIKKNGFEDKLSVSLKEINWNNDPPKNKKSPYRDLFDLSMILAKYFPETKANEINTIAASFTSLNSSAKPGTEEQRLLLTELLNVPNPCAGFELLKECGFLANCWPEIAALNDADHSKEFHPEGNVWKHTMESLRYRKTGGRKTGFDLRLSLGLLLHDCGKPLSQTDGSRRFFAHAELGEVQARRFLSWLGFDISIINDACYLVRNHMLPAALPRLSLSRTGEIIKSPLFPMLLELYRCDESSTFKGLDGYYKSSAAYQAYLKNRKNPYRSADGKKLKRAEIK